MGNVSVCELHGQFQSSPWNNRMKMNNFFQIYYHFQELNEVGTWHSCRSPLENVTSLKNLRETESHLQEWRTN